MTVVLWSTGEIKKTDFIKNLDTVGKSAAYDHWDEACESLDLEFRDGAHRKKARHNTGNTINPSPVLPSIPVILSMGFIGQQVKLVDSFLPDTGLQLSTAGPPDQPQQSHSKRADECARALGQRSFVVVDFAG